MLDKLSKIGKSAYYWLGLAIIGIAAEAVALYYQHVLDEWPCVLCIHVRLWVMALIIVALLVLLLRRLRFIPVAGHLLTIVIAAGLLERSWKLLGTERRFLDGDCGFDLGLPAWFTPDQWLANTPHALFIDDPELKIARVNTSLVEGRVSIVDLHHLVATPEKTIHFVEEHRLGLYAVEEMNAAIERAGMVVSFDEEGITGRGLYIGRLASQD